MRLRVIMFGLLMAPLTAVVAVDINGVSVPKATSTFESEVGVTEFREGGEATIRLAPGPKRYKVCLSAPSPVPVLDAELPVLDTPDRFTVKVEDGREFGRCLLASGSAKDIKDIKKKRAFTYCLRCEDVTTP